MQQTALLRTVLALALLGVVLLPRPPRAAATQHALPPVVNPTTYASPSGEYVFDVNPSAMEGQGPSSCRLKRDGQDAWARELPFTPAQAAVTDDGTVAGYAYDRGPAGFGPAGPGKFHVFVLAPDGRERLHAAVDREDSRFLHDVANPLSTGLFITSDQKTFVVRVREPDINRGGERWWVYELAAGRELAKVDPMPGETGLRFVLRAAPVRGAPLVLANWWHYDDNAATNPGAGFNLIDLSDPRRPKTVWRKVLPGDYQSDEAQEEVRAHGAVARSDEPNRFTVHFVADRQRVTFEVAREGDAWAVREVGRAGHDAAKADAAAPPRPVVSPKRLGTITLRGGNVAAEGPIHDLVDFDTDDQGRFGVVRLDDTDPGVRVCTFALVDADARVVVDNIRPVPDFGDKHHGSQKVAWLRGGRWLVTDCESGPEKTARAWFIDVDGPQVRVTPIDGYDGVPATALAGRSDGSFVVLGRREHKYTLTPELTCYDEKGKRRWSVGEHSGDERQLFSPQDIDVHRAHADAVVVLSHNSDRLQFFGGDGRYSRTVGLEKAFGGKPNYPSKVKFRRDGSLVVNDFGGSPPVRLLKSDGDPLGRMDPRLADGEQVPVRVMKVAADDRVWVSDGRSLLRLGAAGVVDRRLGQPPDPTSPQQVGAIALGPGGNLYTAAGQGLAVQVYDPTGKLLRVLKPDPSDPPGDHVLGGLTVAGDGSVYVAGGLTPYLRYRPDGTRAGQERRLFDDISESWHYVPGTARRWVAGYTAVWLVGEDGKVLREIRRRPDNHWLVHPQAVGVAPDGSAAVVSSAAGRGRSDSAWLSVYAPDGSPVTSVRLDAAGLFPSVAFDGKRAVVSCGSRLLLADTSTGTVAEVKLTDGNGRPAGREDSYWYVLPGAGGKELWLLDANRKRPPVERYEPPAR
jgi:sugar lactone lactonase YvrE